MQFFEGNEFYWPGYDGAEDDDTEGKQDDASARGSQTTGTAKSQLPKADDIKRPDDFYTGRMLGALCGVLAPEQACAIATSCRR